jgi:hypothetical protein
VQMDVQNGLPSDLAVIPANVVAIGPEPPIHSSFHLEEQCLRGGPFLRSEVKHGFPVLSRDDEANA